MRLFELKDLGCQSTHKKRKCPVIATVTYLSDVGAPTMVVSESHSYVSTPYTGRHRIQR